MKPERKTFYWRIYQLIADGAPNFELAQILWHEPYIRDDVAF